MPAAPSRENQARIAGLEAELASLRQRNQELTDFTENAPVGLQWVGADGIILWVNQAELDLLGCRKEEYVGHDVAEFHADPTVIQDMLSRLAARETLRNYQARLRAKDGSIRHVLISSNVLWDDDRFIHTRCITRDITDRVRAVEELGNAHESLRVLAEDARKREELFRAALQNSPLVVFHQNADLRYTWIYNSFIERAGVSLLDKTDFELFPADQAEQLTRFKSGVLASGKGARQELALTTDGQLRIMEMRIEPYRDSSGQLAGIVGTALDITERKRNEQRLIDSRGQLRGLAAHLQVMREKERALTSHEVHDLGQRLTALDQELAVVARHLAEGASPDVMAERLREVSEILGPTIESSARISTGLRPSLLDNLGLAVTLDGHAREFAARTGIRVISEALEDVSPDPDVGIAIFRILQQVLTNVERHSHAGEVRISLRRVGRSLVLKVSDNGTGISNEKVADPRSLGLMAMRELALLCSGQFDIHGNPETGTTVYLEIPLDARISDAAQSGGDFAL
jgi:PAS domain S-box-containing protein